MKPWKDRTDLELIEAADTGFHGLGSIVEATRRLREAVLEEERTIKRLTRWLVRLTWALTIFTAVLIGLEVWRLIQRAG